MVPPDLLFGQSICICIVGFSLLTRLQVLSHFSLVKFTLAKVAYSLCSWFCCCCLRRHFFLLTTSSAYIYGCRAFQQICTLDRQRISLRFRCGEEVPKDSALYERKSKGSS